MEYMDIDTFINNVCIHSGKMMEQSRIPLEAVSCHKNHLEAKWPSTPTREVHTINYLGLWGGHKHRSHIPRADQGK